MIIGDPDMKEFRPAKKRVEVSVGESVRIIRELQELSKSQLSELTGIPQLRPTVTPFPLWTALPPAEYYEVIRPPEGHRPSGAF